ncbi:MAG: ChbG/HpnK family deacetylase [Verrucomicrobiia bacterium]
MAREIFFTADDFGLTSEVNAAIIHAHHHGKLHGAALMMGQPATEEAITLARKTPSLQIGLHLHLNDSQPLTMQRWPWDQSPTQAGFAIGFSSQARELARREIQQQWQAFQATDLPCAFINAHHHIHAHPYVYYTLLQTISYQFQGWIRLGKTQTFKNKTNLPTILMNHFFRLYKKFHSFRMTNTLWGVDRTFCMNPDEIRQTIVSLGDGLHEFIFHPRKIRNDLDTECLLALRSCSLV